MNETPIPTAEVRRLLPVGSFYSINWPTSREVIFRKVTKQGTYKMEAEVLSGRLAGKTTNLTWAGTTATVNEHGQITLSDEGGVYAYIQPGNTPDA